MTTTPIKNTQTARCEHCNHSTLALLLLRPSPVAKAGALVPPGAAAVADAGVLAQGLLPARVPTESRTVLRLLRAGFVHVYLPSPPAGVKPWHVWQVTDNGDLVAQSNPAFNPAMPSAVCCRKDHNVAGMRLLPLPQAHKLGTVWIAFSANLWNDKLRKDNAANPSAMQAVNLAGGSPNTFKPLTADLQSKVLECALARLSVNGVSEHDFPFASVAGEADTLAKTMVNAALAHPMTAGKELAVVLADPVGYASELNALRIRRFQMAQTEAAKPENAYAMASLQMMEGLRKSIIDANEARKFDATSPVMSRGAFEDMQLVKPHPRGWPEGTQWERMTDRADIAAHGYGMGRVTFPDQAERADEWLHMQSGATFDGAYRKYLDEPAIERWMKQYEQHMKSAHSEPLARFEADWWAARWDGLYNAYFALHFDENDSNDPRQRHSAGAIYAQEVQLSQTPQPLAEGPVQAQYAEELRKKVHDVTAQGWRALVGNQAALFPALDGFITTQRPDKLHDLGAGVFNALKEQLSPIDMRYGWLAHAGFGVSSLSITQSWMAVVAAIPGAATSAMSDLSQVSSALLAAQTLAMARDSAARGTWLRTPVQVSAQFPLKEAQEMLNRLRALGGKQGLPSNTELKRYAATRKSGMVDLTFASDNHELRAMGGDLKAALGSGKGSVALGSRGAAGLPQTAGTLKLTAAQFAQLLEGQPQRIQQAADAMREMALLGKGVTLSLSGQIGLLGVWLNGTGAYDTFFKLHKSPDLVLAASFMDAVFGTLAGVVQITEAAMSASITNRLGAEAAKNALSLLGTRAVIAGFGAASGVAVVVGQGIKAARDAKAGNTMAAFAYAGSAVAFLGLTTTSGIQFVGAFSDFMIAKGSKAAVWRLGSAAAASAEKFLLRRVVLLGVATGLSGVGLIFLAGGLVFEVWALAATPDALQNHVRRSRFGKGPNNYKTLEEELAELDKVFGRPDAKAIALAHAVSQIPTQ